MLLLIFTNTVIVTITLLFAPIVYWLGYRPFKAEKRDRYPLGVLIK